MTYDLNKYIFLILRALISNFKLFVTKFISSCKFIFLFFYDSLYVFSVNRKRMFALFSDHTELIVSNVTF